MKKRQSVKGQAPSISIYQKLQLSYPYSKLGKGPMIDAPGGGRFSRYICNKNLLHEHRKIAAYCEQKRRDNARYVPFVDVKTQDALSARRLYLRLHDVDTASPTHETRRSKFFRFNLEAMRDWRIMYGSRWPKLPKPQIVARMQVIWIGGGFNDIDFTGLGNVSSEFSALGKAAIKQSLADKYPSLLDGWPRNWGFSGMIEATESAVESLKSLSASFYSRTAPQPVETHQEKQKDRHGRTVYRGYFNAAKRRKY
jgi:hypothetical protein